MEDIPPGLSFDQNDEGYILRRRDEDGRTVEITISPLELLTLRETIVLWTDRIRARLQAAAGPDQAVVVHPVARVRLLPDVAQENMLLTIVAPSGQQMTLSFPDLIAQHIADELRRLLRSMRAARPTKQ